MATPSGLSAAQPQAIVLSGGGAYAAYEVGVLKALLAGRSPATAGEPLRATILTGTSAGAFNAAMLLSTEAEDGAASLEKVWLDKVAATPGGNNGVFRLRGDLRRFLHPEVLAQDPAGPMMEAAEDAAWLVRDLFARTISFLESGEPLERRAAEMIDLSALISTEPFRRLVEQNVRIETIRGSGRVIRIAATNWKTGELVVFGNADITHASVLASAAIPGIFPPVDIAGAPYVDGGVLMNTPLKPAIDAGAEVLHVVVLDPAVRNLASPAKVNTLETIERLLLISADGLLKTDLQLAAAVNRGLAQDSGHRRIQIHVYRPKADAGGVFGMLDFARARLEKLIEAGVRDAEQHDCAKNRCIV